MDYIGSWYLENNYVSASQVAEDMVLVDLSPYEYEYTSEDLFAKALSLGHLSDEIILELFILTCKRARDEMQDL